MKNFFTKIFLLTLTICATIFFVSSPAEAVVVKGFAPIVNGDLDGAKREARKQAMRDAVEAVAGVQVNSTTEVANFMVVKDEIVLKSDGYVTINRVIKEEAQGNIFYVELDINASAERIRQFAQDLKSQIENNVNDSNSRGGIMTAVIEKNSGIYSYTPEFGDYLNYKLKLAGFRVETNDNVLQYLVRNATDPELRIKARSIAKDNREAENALLRGVLDVESVRRVGGAYEATVNASFELIGLDSSEVDVFSKVIKGAAATERDAIHNAKENATREAMESLSRQALETVQNETRGGYINIKTTVIFDNVTNYQAQYPLIKAGLDSARCKVIRMTRPSATKLAFFVSSDAYSNIGELQAAIEGAIPGIQAGITPPGELGATKIHLTF